MGFEGVAGQAGGGQAGEGTGPHHVRRAAARSRALGDVVDQELGELLAVARAPDPWIAADEALGASLG